MAFMDLITRECNGQVVVCLRGELDVADAARVAAALPLVQRIACWSARHSKTGVAEWFGLADAALLAGHLAGTQSLPQYDLGQAGQGEQVLH